MTSVFKVTPKNILGLEAQKFKSKLLALALSEPSTYFELRDEVYQKIVETNVEQAYNLYWSILTDGIVGGNQIKVLKKDRSEFNFTPKLPESEVNTFALEVVIAKYPELVLLVGAVPPPPILVIPLYDTAETDIEPELGELITTVPTLLHKLLNKCLCGLALVENGLFSFVKLLF